MLLLLVATSAAAVPLSYEEALRRAAGSAGSVATAEVDVRVAEASLLAARAPYEPTASASGSYFSSTSEGAGQFGRFFAETSGWSAELGVRQVLASGTALDVGLSSSESRFLYRLAEVDTEFTDDPQFESRLSVTLSQALLQGHRLGWNLRQVRAATNARDLAELSLDTRRQQAVADAARAFWQARYQRALVDIARRTLALTEEQARVTEALVDAGRLAAVESTRTEAAVVQARRATLEAESAAAAADDTLLVLVGERPGSGLELLPPPLRTPPETAFDEASLVETVLRGNPELRAARASVEHRDAELRDARHALLPELGATASGSLRGYEPSLGAAMGELASGDLGDWSVGGTLSVPLLNRADRASVDSASAELERARIAVRQLEDNLATQARAQVRTLRTASEDVALARANVELAEATLTAEQARLAEGRALQRDVGEAIRALDQARIDAERAVTSWTVALVELDRLKGGL